MKKIRLIQGIGIVLFLSYIALFLVDVYTGVIGEYLHLLLSLLMAIIGLNLVFKGVLIKSNSTLWFANVLITLSITIVVFEIVHIDIQDYLYVLSIVPLFASFLNLIVFNNLIYIKVIILNVTIIVPSIINHFHGFDVYWSIGLFVISILIGIMICRLINLDEENV